MSLTYLCHTAESVVGTAHLHQGTISVQVLGDVASDDANDSTDGTGDWELLTLQQVVLLNTKYTCLISLVAPQTGHDLIIFC